MKQKIFLTSALAMGFVAPAIAEPSHTGEFPSDGYMEEDYTYTNAATSDNMDGVYSGTVNAVAEYDIIDYIVNAGQYLPADSETVITCPAGSYCPGISGNVQYNQSTPQGIQTCPTGYDSSAAGASSDTQCYRQCSGNVTIEHATGVTGNDYYGNGTDTCEPTGCVNGWHIKEGIPDLINMGFSSLNTVDSGIRSGIINGEGVIALSNSSQIRVDARCSNVQGGYYPYDTSTIPEQDILSNVSEYSGEGARTCWCQMTGYRPNGETAFLNTSSIWVYSPSMTPNDCGMCLKFCVDLSYGSRIVRETFFDSVTPTLASCEANTITINWSDAAQTDIDANNAGTATYGEDVRTPVKAATKKGQTFRGWRFSAPQQTNLPE